MKGGKQQRQPSSSLKRLDQVQLEPLSKTDYFYKTYQRLDKKDIINEKPLALPPRASSIKKTSYKIEDNMTDCKIQQAKRGLQLLKKKTNRNGIIQENSKNNSAQKKEDDINYSAKNIQKQEIEEEKYQRQEQKRQPNIKISQKRRKSEELYEQSLLIPANSFEDKASNRRSEIQEYVNINEQIPIQGNHDFMAILQRQMAKERAGSQQDLFANQLDFEEQELSIECEKGCGRKFNLYSLQRHERICKQIFQSKRKVFNSTQYRMDQFSRVLNIPALPTMKEQKRKNSKKIVKQYEDPKWKVQSGGLRAWMKQGRGEQLTGEEKVISEKATGMTYCNVCGRQFHKDARKRHMENCQKLANRVPKR